MSHRRAVRTLLLLAAATAAAASAAAASDEVAVPFDPWDFMVMDQTAGDRLEHYFTTGWTRCVVFDPGWCADRLVRPAFDTAFNLTLRLPPSPYRPCREAFVLLKDRRGTALERYCGDDGEIRVEAEKGWDGTARRFAANGKVSGPWGLRQAVAGEVTVERGQVITFGCGSGSGAPPRIGRMETASFWLGPYPIGEAKQRLAAARDLAPWSPPDRDAVPSAWAELPAGFTREQKSRSEQPVTIVLRVDFWSPFDARRLGEGAAAEELPRFYRNGEVYVYGAVGYGTPEQAGLGLVGWWVMGHGAPDAPLAVFRETLMTNLAFGRRVGAVPLGECPALGD